MDNTHHDLLKMQAVFNEFMVPKQEPTGFEKAIYSAKEKLDQSKKTEIEKFLPEAI